MNAEMEKFRAALALLKELFEKRMSSDPVYVELAAASACVARARRILLERGGE